MNPPTSKRQAFVRALVLYSFACGYVLGTVWGTGAGDE